MKTLFLMIIVLVYSIGNLVAPDKFNYKPVSHQATATPTTRFTPQPNSSNGSDTDNYPVIQRGGSDAPVPVNTGNSGTAGNSPTEMFGEAKVADTFDRGSSGFGLSAGLNDDENIRIIALNNRLSLEPKKNNGWISWRLRPPVIQSGAVEMQFSIITCARGDRAGIMMHTPDYNSGNGYYFSLACEGTVSILRDSTVLGTADARNVFKNSSGDINVISAVVQGNTMTLMLNGTSLITVQDSTYAEGFSGFFVSPQGDKTLTMDILSFNEYYPDE
ncbi:MAG: hypothetical protein IKP86_03610 [Anaerolineaceae bacterium]|nr:hypothetical protein [Anaerolineaceae bacterium]